MGFLSEPTHWIFILLIALILFGGKKLPELGKGLGEGLKGFREGLKGINDPSPVSPSVQQTAAPAPPAVSTQNEFASGKENMEYVTCSRCGNRFENPLGFKVTDYVCRACQKSS
jgi:sec-independent protein translocase protein TatA